jgi:uncharacterized OsmC-like protein
MRIILESETSVRLAAGSEGVVLEPARGVALSPFHLLAASLATCTWSVLMGWAGAASLDVAGLELVVAWEFGGDPVRVEEMRMGVEWPGLPAGRRGAAERAARQCTVHHTLEHGSRVVTRVLPGPGEGGGEGGGGGGPERR